MKTINYSTVTFNELEEIFDIEKIKGKEFFKEWFSQDYNLSNDEDIFLNQLLDRNVDLLNNYTELELISKFIAPILNQVNFRLKKKVIRDFYEASLKVEFNNILFNGRCDFVVASGYDLPIKPYFFIQEFKQASGNLPETQLLAEMIAATIVNNSNKIKGAYIMGTVWNFTILEKKENKYIYYTSKSLDSSDIDDLKQIYKNLQIVKREIYESN